MWCPPTAFLYPLKKVYECSSPNRGHEELCVEVFLNMLKIVDCTKNMVFSAIGEYKKEGKTLFLEKPYNFNAALSGLKKWVIMCREAKPNPLF